MRWLLLLLVLPFLLNNVVLAMLSDPWAPWRFSGKTGAVAADLPALPIFIPEPGRIGHGNLSDADRYRLALSVGFSAAEAIIATAISIAEDGSGDPAIMSPRNSNGTFDLGLWQINSGHWSEFGGADALTVPANNARAARVLYLRGGWTQWCTYPGGCGGGPGSPVWPQALARARTAAATPLPPGQA